MVRNAEYHSRSRAKLQPPAASNPSSGRAANNETWSKASKSSSRWSNEYARHEARSLRNSNDEMDSYMRAPASLVERTHHEKPSAGKSSSGKTPNRTLRPSSRWTATASASTGRLLNRASGASTYNDAPAPRGMLRADIRYHTDSIKSIDSISSKLPKSWPGSPSKQRSAGRTAYDSSRLGNITSRQTDPRYSNTHSLLPTATTTVIHRRRPPLLRYRNRLP